MKFYILAPANIVSGGPELAHQMCAELNSINHEAYMYYYYIDVKGPADAPCVEKFLKYNTKSVTDHSKVDLADNVVIVPEGMPERIFTFKNAKKVLWWMSVDNFYANGGKLDEVRDEVYLHLVQSKYAEDHLLKNGIDSSRICTVSDYISDAYGKFILPPEYRKNMALFNPKKGLDDIRNLIQETINDIEWVPLMNLTEDQMVAFMQMAKVYVDFGHHPGKDRIPREAAMCGCVVVTNRKGSAKFYEDVPIPDMYKVDTDNCSLETQIELIKFICDNYKNCFAECAEYRNAIGDEREKFHQEVIEFTNIICK